MNFFCPSRGQLHVVYYNFALITIVFCLLGMQQIWECSHIAKSKSDEEGNMSQQSDRFQQREREVKFITEIVHCNHPQQSSDSS